MNPIKANDGQHQGCRLKTSKCHQLMRIPASPADETDKCEWTKEML